MNVQPDVRYRKYVLALLTTVGVCAWIDRQVFAILMEAIKADFLLTDTQLGLLGGVAFGLFYATLGLPVAWLADRYNRRNIIAISLTLWSAMTALCGLATGFATLFLGRIGVGIGEAGGSPPSQSLISDYYPPEKRGSALGVYFLFLPVGFMAGFLLGGWINQFLGWRETFVAVGVPGLFLALLLRLTLKEPLRGATERQPPLTRARPPSIVETLRHFLSMPSLRHIPLGGAIHGIGAWGVGIWVPAYFMRMHGMSSGEVGTWLACAYGLGGSAGVVLGGRLADYLAARSGDPRWYLWMASTVITAAVPFSFVVYLATTPLPALVCFFLPTFLGHMFLGPVMAMMQNLAGPRRRSQAAAYYLFLANLISMGLGPLIVGASSDLFGAEFGADAIRYSILILVAVTSLWSALHFLLAARTLRADLNLAALEGPDGTPKPADAR